MEEHAYFRKTAGFAFMLIVMLSGSIMVRAEERIIYVNSSVPAGGDGESWNSAFNSLSEALAAAKSGDGIWVAAGTYYPTTDDDRDASFVLKEGASLYGGFKGSEEQVSQRDWRGRRTILSGDIGEKGVSEDNVFHVVRGADEAALDGFVITGGYSLPGGMAEGGGSPMEPGFTSGPGRERQSRRPGFAGEGRLGPRQRPGFVGGPGGRRGRGTELPGGLGGRRAIHTSPEEIMRGAGVGQGAGMLNYQAAPTVRNCIFENNQGRKGGGVYNMTSTRFPPPSENSKIPVFVNCVFRKNHANGRGGGVSNDLGTSPVFLSCIFEENQTAQKGGGMYNDFGCSPILMNCLFTGNRARSAAGMGNDGGSSPVLYHCTFTRNRAEDAGPSVYQGTGPANNPTLVRCVVWGNSCRWESKGLYNWHDCMPIVTESIVEGGFPGTGNAEEYPGLNQQGVTSLAYGYKPKAEEFRESELSKLLSAFEPAKRVRPGPGPRPEAENIPHSERVVYVDSRRKQKGNGRSWATAHRSLQNAITDASADGAEVWVAAGTYRPSSIDRSASFVLSGGIRLYGGFAGNEKRRDERDSKKYASILSGDIGKPDVQTDNVFHVLVGANEAVLDGFTITGGYADGIGYDGKGGGIVDYQKGVQSRPNAPRTSGYSPTVKDCIFARNYARDGGAVYNYDRNTPRFVDCTFENNTADNGGAVLDRVGVQGVYQSCDFVANTATWRGGAVYFDYGSRPVLEQCTFRGNSTGGHGGAIYSLSRASQLENTTATITDCRFEENESAGNGGAAAFHDSTIAFVSKSLFRANTAGQNGGAIAVTERSAIESSRNAFNDNRASREGNDIYRDSSVGASGQRTASGPALAASRAQGSPEAPTRHAPISDFSVITVGTGAPQYNPERAGACTIIQYEGRYILVDMGNGAQARLHEAGILLSQFSMLMFTHHHLDHNEEFIPLLIRTRLQGGGSQIIGPVGTKEYVDFVFSFYREDIAYRAQRRGKSVKEMRNVNVREIQGDESIELGGLRIRTAEMNHTIYTLAYRFDAGGRSIVISGDTSYSENLITLAKDADILVMDSGALVRKNSPVGRVRRSARIGPGRIRNTADTPAGPEAHASLEEVANMAQKANVRQLVLTHFTPDEIDTEATIRKFREIYDGQVVFAQDLFQTSPQQKAGEDEVQ